MTSEEQMKETEAYLARIRKTIAESNRLVEAANLRMAETDRMLESQGLTREQVMGFKFTDEQREAVNRELVRQGMEPLEVEGLEVEGLKVEGRGGDDSRPSDLRPADLQPATDAEGELANRQRKFGMMMKPFQI